MLQEKGNDLLSYATEALSEMKEELTIGIVKIEAIGDPEKQTFSGVMGQTPYFMKWVQERMRGVEMEKGKFTNICLWKLNKKLYGKHLAQYLALYKVPIDSYHHCFYNFYVVIPYHLNINCIHSQTKRNICVY